MVKLAVRPLRAEQDRLAAATVCFETAPGRQAQVDWDPEAFRRLATRLDCSPDEVLSVDADATSMAGTREARLAAHGVGGATGVRAGLASRVSGAGDGRPLTLRLSRRLSRVDAPGGSRAPG